MILCDDQFETRDSVQITARNYRVQPNGTPLRTTSSVPAKCPPTGRRNLQSIAEAREKYLVSLPTRTFCLSTNTILDHPATSTSSIDKLPIAGDSRTNYTTIHADSSRTKRPSSAMIETVHVEGRTRSPREHFLATCEDSNEAFNSIGKGRPANRRPLN